MAHEPTLTHGDGLRAKFEVAASTSIFQGDVLAMMTTGFVRPAAAANLTDQVVGVATTNVDNSVGSAGDLEVIVNTDRQSIGNVTIVGTGGSSVLAATDMGADVYITSTLPTAFSVIANSGPLYGKVTGFAAVGDTVGEVTFGGYTVGSHETYRSEEIIIPIELKGILADGDVITDMALPGGAGIIDTITFYVTDPSTTAGDLTTLALEIGATAVTGGALALTSANTDAQADKVAGTAITALNTWTDGDTLTVTAASTTAFAEGSGYIHIETRVRG